MSGEAKLIDTDNRLLSAVIRRYPLEWCVVYCNPKCERRAFAGLMEAGVLSYLPQETFQRKQPKTKKMITVTKPVFPRYLFAGIDRTLGQSWGSVRACDGVEGIVSFEENGNPTPVSATDIADVMFNVSDENRPKPGSFIKVGRYLQLVVGGRVELDALVTAHEEGADSFQAEVTMFGAKRTITASVDDVKRSA